MEEKNRNLVMNFDKRRLNTSIMLHLRRRGVQSYLIGTDFLKGVIFGMCRHPEISLDEAVEKAVKASNFPGAKMEVENGYNCIADALELDFANFEDMRADVGAIVEDFIEELYKEFCYEITVRTLEEKMGSFKYSVGEEIIKCMLFKKLYAPESTYECMCEYALRKVSSEIDEKIEWKDVLNEVAPLLKGEELEDYIYDLEDFAYKNNQFGS